MIKFTQAENLKELNRIADQKVVYAGYYSPSQVYPYNKVRQYRLEGSSETFEIIYNSDIENFVQE